MDFTFFSKGCNMFLKDERQARETTCGLLSLKHLLPGPSHNRFVIPCLRGRLSRAKGTFAFVFAGAGPSSFLCILYLLSGSGGRDLRYFQKHLYACGEIIFLFFMQNMPLACTWPQWSKLRRTVDFCIVKQNKKVPINKAAWGNTLKYGT